MSGTKVNNQRPGIVPGLIANSVFFIEPSDNVINYYYVAMLEALQQEEYRNEREHIRLLDDEEEFVYQPPLHLEQGYRNATIRCVLQY